MNTVWCLAWCSVIFSFARSTPINSDRGLIRSQLLNRNALNLDWGSVCVYNDNIYPAGTNFTTNNPCETCTCDPPKYNCHVQSCDLKLGCKAIQTVEVCCPVYICDCEKNGKRYTNGEKVEEVNPCKVCYCSGGEIKCSLVTCYFREDCKPIRVEGRCCPKYENCPPFEVMKNKRTLDPTSVTATDSQESETVEKERETKNLLEWANSSERSPREETKLPSVATLEVIEIHPTEPAKPHDRGTLSTGVPEVHQNNFERTTLSFLAEEETTLVEDATEASTPFTVSNEFEVDQSTSFESREPAWE